MSNLFLFCDNTTFINLNVKNVNYPSSEKNLVVDEAVALPMVKLINSYSNKQRLGKIYFLY